MNSKYVLALPLYRQEQELRRLGLPVSRQSMSNWVLTAGERWLLPVYHALHKELLANKILHADETTLMVLREPERQARQRSYVWLYRTSGDALRPIVLYDYQPSRAGVCASRFLKGFSAICIRMGTRHIIAVCPKRYAASAAGRICGENLRIR